MVNAREWLEENYPDKGWKTEKIYINQQLEGELDCSGYDKLREVFISHQIDSSKFEIKNASYKDGYGGTQETRIVHCIPAQDWLDKNYPQNGTNKYGKTQTRTEITKLDIYYRNLEGTLDLSDFTNLEILSCSGNKLTSLDISNCDKLREINCWDNQLTNLGLSNLNQLKQLQCFDNHLTQIIYPSNPEQLTNLFINNNNFSQDLSIFSQFKNLENLRIDNNPFTNSLEPLKDLKKLKCLHISSTDINTGIEFLPESLEVIFYNSWDKPSCKLTEIKDQLDQKYWVDIHKGFGNGKIHKKEWLAQGFTKEQTKEWIDLGVKPYSLEFLNWFLNFKKLDLNWALENEEEFRDLRDKYENFKTCEECQKPNTNWGWCQSCNAKHFARDFDKWTSGNEKIDEFILNCQLEATSPWNVLEWIPYEKFNNIEHIAQGGFGKVYKAEWIGGSIWFWNRWNKNWWRGKDGYYDNGWKSRDYETVALKTLTNSQNLNQEFLSELTLYKMFRSEVSNMVPCYGVSKDKEGNYIMVMKHMKEGSLKEYLKKNYQKLEFKKNKDIPDKYEYPKLNFLKQISQGLKDIHRKNLVHQDFHSGNIIVDEDRNYRGEIDKINCRITDLGLSKPVNETDNGQVYGIMPYMAPEILRNQPYTQASDIYSLGMVMYEILTGLPPFYEYDAHDELFALRICQGVRPKFPSQVKYPQLLVDLIKRCWDGEPSNRPKAREISGIISGWFEEKIKSWNKDSLKKDTELYQQIEKVKKHNETLPEEIRYPNYQNNNIWHSKLINTKQITEKLKTIEYSADLAIDFGQLNLENQNWTSIHSNFTPELIQQWQSLGFTYQQTQGWINIGLQPTDHNFCSWLRDNKQLTPEQVLNKGNLEQLNQEFFAYWQEQQQTNIEIPPKNS